MKQAQERAVSGTMSTMILQKNLHNDGKAVIMEKLTGNVVRKLDK